MMEKDFYSILGVDKNVSSEDLKHQYRKLSMQWHPDRWVNGTDEEKKIAEDKFKQISEAYSVLSDPEKRNRYDNGGMDFDMGGFDPMDIFAKMQEDFGGFGGVFDSFFGRRQNQVNRGSDISINVTLTLEEAYKGGPREVIFKKQIECTHCNGTGSSDGKDTTCPDCKGKGVTSTMKQIRPGSFSMFTGPCKKCGGMGKIITNPCPYCLGSGFEMTEVKETINLPRGLSNGMTVTIQGLGSKPKGNGVDGNLIININVIEDSYFYRPDMINLIHYEDVPFNECLLGFKKDFRCIDGSTVTVNAKELTPHGESFIFKGKGMPNPNNERQIGDYAVVINYKIPSHLTKEQKEKLKNF